MMDTQIGSRTGQGWSPAPLPVPERPALAPNVQLLGEMPETDFKDQPWLIQRDGQFLQVTELLYRLAEQLNGERSLAEIAERVTASTEWLVAADDVRQLLRTWLMPLGLVAAADGSSSPPVAGNARKSGSPLALHARVKTLSPQVIDPITRVLQVLYAPPVLITMLIAALVGHLWLYRVHGITGSIRDVLYTPGGLPLTLVSIILAGFLPRVRACGRAAVRRR